MKPQLLYITAKDKKQARAIAAALLTERLIACANIFDGIESLYVWEGKFCDDHEAAMVCKTTDKLLCRVVKRVKELHSYKVPCIVALPIVGGNPDFLKWIEQETGPVPSKKSARTTRSSRLT